MDVLVLSWKAQRQIVVSEAVLDEHSVLTGNLRLVYSLYERYEHTSQFKFLHETLSFLLFYFLKNLKGLFFFLSPCTSSIVPKTSCSIIETHKFLANNTFPSSDWNLEYGTWNTCVRKHWIK